MILFQVDMMINVIFTVEVVMKVIGEDWHPWRYFYTAWNNFDFIIGEGLIGSGWCYRMLSYGIVSHRVALLDLLPFPSITTPCLPPQWCRRGCLWSSTPSTWTRLRSAHSSLCVVRPG